MASLRVVKDRVLIEIEAAVNQTAGGLFLPESRKERDHIGTVVSVGSEVRDIVPGDRVLYNAYSEKMERDGKSYRVAKAENVLAVIEPGADVTVPSKGLSGQVAYENLD